MSAASRRAWFDRHRQVNTWVAVRDFEALRKLAERNELSLAETVREILQRALQDPPQTGEARG